jgi:hypothetical protein
MNVREDSISEDKQSLASTAKLIDNNAVGTNPNWFLTTSFSTSVLAGGTRHRKRRRHEYPSLRDPKEEVLIP